MQKHKNGLSTHSFCQHPAHCLIWPSTTTSLSASPIHLYALATLVFQYRKRKKQFHSLRPFQMFPVPGLFLPLSKCLACLHLQPQLKGLSFIEIILDLLVKSRPLHICFCLGTLFVSSIVIITACWYFVDLYILWFYVLDDPNEQTPCLSC